MAPSSPASPNGSTNGVDEHFLRSYRRLLDAEDEAFDELEHAFEDGDRAHYESDYAAWREALERRTSFLDRSGFGLPTSAAL